MDTRTEIVTHLLAARQSGSKRSILDEITNKDIHDAFTIADKVIRKNNEINERIDSINSNRMKEVYENYEPEQSSSGDY